jgi:hypothetical protein
MLNIDMIKINVFPFSTDTHTCFLYLVKNHNHNTSEKVYIPNIDTKTGDVFRVSASGNVIETVSTDPRLVPSHSVGMSADGSIGN